MDKESAIELPKIDKNCNDCKHLSRDLNAYNHSKTLHHLWQRKAYDKENSKRLEKAEYWLNQNEWEKARLIIDEVNKSKFSFNNDAHISFGECIKKIQPVSFIANTCQTENEFCFEHRKE